jgi:hypothetical protein
LNRLDALPRWRRWVICLPVGIACTFIALQIIEAAFGIGSTPRVVPAIAANIAGGLLALYLIRSQQRDAGHWRQT